MSVQLRQRMSLGCASLICAAFTVVSPCYAQVSDAEVDKRLQQLERLKESGHYSDEEIAEAKNKLLDLIVDLSSVKRPTSSESRLSDNELYEDYRQRRKERRKQALDLRRQYALMQPPARGWLAYRMPFPIMPSGNMIEKGHVRQPPVWVPRRRYLVVPYDYDYDYGYDYDYDYDYDYPRPRL